MNPVSQGMAALMQGLGAGGQQAYQNAYNKQAGLNTQLALQRAQMEKLRAETELKRKEFERSQQGIATLPSAVSGLNQDQIGSLDAWNAGGQMGPVQQWATPQAQRGIAIGRQLQALQRAGGGNVYQMAQALDALRKSNIGQRVLQGDLSGADLGNAMAIIGASKVFDTNGQNQYTGAANTPMGRANIGKLGAETAAADALAYQRNNPYMMNGGTIFNRNTGQATTPAPYRADKAGVVNTVTGQYKPNPGGGGRADTQYIQPNQATVKMAETVLKSILPADKLGVASSVAPLAAGRFLALTKAGIPAATAWQQVAQEIATNTTPEIPSWWWGQDTAPVYHPGGALSSGGGSAGGGGGGYQFDYVPGQGLVPAGK